MVNLFLSTLKAFSPLVAFLWITGFLTSKLSKNRVRFPTFLAVLCGYPHKGSYVNLLGACCQLTAYILPVVATLIAYFAGKGLIVYLLVMLMVMIIPMFLYVLLQRLLQSDHINTQ
jgi:hypothetical protein